MGSVKVVRGAINVRTVVKVSLADWLLGRRLTVVNRIELSNSYPSVVKIEGESGGVKAEDVSYDVEKDIK